jgi:ADP-heptose:LPS heptosyltransferase
MRTLDLVITIDSMPAHLAGALALPVWTLLRRDADWRWMTHRNDSPWYPTMRLFRQERDGDWEGVVERVTRELERMNAER